MSFMSIFHSILYWIWTLFLKSMKRNSNEKVHEKKLCATYIFLEITRKNLKCTCKSTCLLRLVKLKKNFYNKNPSLI